MGKLLPSVLDSKLESIISHEMRFAKAVARSVIGEHSPTIWDIIIPIGFFYNLFRYKRAREIFALNFLFTKKMAARAAFVMLEKNRSRDEALSDIRKKTSQILSSHREGIYSSKIRQRQMKEVELLIDHYLILLRAEGRDYDSMVRNGYKTMERYSVFLSRLKEAEREVNRAALQTLKTAKAPEIAARMEETTERLRRYDMERIFGR